ncbi:MAG TPA: hypothetical protein VFW66_00920 [Gemmatimonadales bacterium]|nr:hypothetical protein [Gemmatimonadales bacterium]
MRWRALLGLMAAWGGGNGGLAGCSNLPVQNGIAGLEVQVPDPPAVEVGQTIVLHAHALDQNGDSVAAPITWASPDAGVSLTSDGHLTGVTGGVQARVQARTDSIFSDFITFTVNFRPDTLALTGDSMLTVAAGITTSAPLAAAIFARAPALQPLTAETIHYQVTSPAFADPAQRTVELSGGVLSLDAHTGSDGAPTPAVTLNRVSGRTAPASAVVMVSATTATGSTVPGSGQRFVVTFQ